MIPEKVDYWSKIVASLTEEEKKYLLNCRRRKLADGRRMTNAEIGAKIGKPGHWVSGVCLALGSRSRMGKRKPAANLSEQDIALFKQMWTDGVSCKEIGRRWGYQDDWASVRAHKLGLPPRNRPLTNRQVAEIQRRLEAGETHRSISEALGVSCGAIVRYSKGVKVPPRQPKGPPRKIDRGLADRMLRSGRLQKDVAAYFGVTRYALRLAIRQYRKHLEELSARKPTVLIPPVRPFAFLKEAA